MASFSALKVLLNLTLDVRFILPVELYIIITQIITHLVFSRLLSKGFGSVLDQLTELLNRGLDVTNTDAEVATPPAHPLPPNLTNGVLAMNTEYYIV